MLAAALWVSTVAALSISAQTYTITNLGTLGGTWSWPYSINSSGQVVGSSLTAGDASQHAFLWTQAGGMLDLGTLGGTRSEARSINGSGQVVGVSEMAGNASRHAFLWTRAEGMIDLSTFGVGDTVPNSINDSGQVVGGPAPLGHAFLWTQAGGVVDLGTLGGAWSLANSINGSGQVVGLSMTAGQYLHAFLWTQAGGMVDLGTLGGTRSEAQSINGSGQVVGWSYTAANTARAFLWTQVGGMVDLGTLGGTSSWAMSINGSGQVVGISQTAGDTVHAFLWTQAGGMVDLNTLVPGSLGIVLYGASAISDSGFIIADSIAGPVVLGVSSSAPVLGPISANDPVAAGSPILVSAQFTDADVNDAHTAVWTWGDGGGSPGTVSEAAGSGSAAGSHTYVAAGIYTVGVKVTDSAGRSAQVSRNVVVYDPSAGFVAGSGWVMSPPGAFKQGPTLAGRANFAFVSRYQKGATTPSGNTQFQFQAASLEFYSDNYDWLVISGSRAQYKGAGAINGTGTYKFLLTAIDGDVAGLRSADRFRIKIWNHDSTTNQDVVVYDNQTDSSTDGTSTEGALLGGGIIVIHK